MSQKPTNPDTLEKTRANQIIVKAIGFLSVFMPITLAKRIICIALIVGGKRNEQVTQLSGFCEKTVQQLRKGMEEDNIDNLFKIGGGGRKSKFSGIEEAIIDEVTCNQYHSRQQIADMVLEKYGVKVSVWAVGKLLKKRN